MFEYVAALEWSPDGSLLAVATTLGWVSVLKPSGKLACSFEAHAHGLNAIRWSPNGAMLATAGQDGRARIFEPLQGQVLTELSAGSSWVERLAWSPDSKRLATAAGKRVKLWDATRSAPNAQPLRTFPPQAATVSALEWRKQALFVACYGGVTAWAVNAAQVTPETTSPQARFEYQGAPLVMALSPNNAVLAIGCQDACIHLWYTATGEDLEMYGFATKLRSLAWDSTSRFLATTGGAEVSVWDFTGAGPAGSTPGQLIGHGDLIHEVAFQANTSVLASVCQDGSLYLWKPRPNEQVRPFAFGLEPQGEA
ncbi:MAG: WD40 repeat domain-containing protein, partial [Pleurocapsa sp. SU_196_0]|nr:WD40 repeat domain-containing protein [Pleurocapsa sp. SU_196_0]